MAPLTLQRVLELHHGRQPRAPVHGAVRCQQAGARHRLLAGQRRQAVAHARLQRLQLPVRCKQPRRRATPCCALAGAARGSAASAAAALVTRLPQQRADLAAQPRNFRAKCAAAVATDAARTAASSRRGAATGRSAAAARALAGASRLHGLLQSALLAAGSRRLARPWLWRRHEPGIQLGVPCTATRQRLQRIKLLKQPLQKRGRMTGPGAAANAAWGYGPGSACTGRW